MKIADVIAPLERLAPTALQEGYDNSGLLVGHWNDEVEGALICLDCTEAVVDEAIEHGIGLIIAHHPIVFRGLNRFNGKNYVERVVQKAIKNDIALYACHTNLDKVHGGVNTKIAEKLGLSDTKILQPERDHLCKVVVYAPTKHAEEVRNALFAAGTGHIGDYSECSFSTTGTGTFRAGEGSDPFVGKVGERHREEEERIEVVCTRWQADRAIQAMVKAHPYEEVAYEIFPILNHDQTRGLGMIGTLENALNSEELLAHIKRSMALTAFRFAGSTAGAITKVALCGGSGFDLLLSAKACGAQVYITSDIKYHQFFDAEDDLILVDIGHYESEQYTIELIAGILKADLPKFAIRLTGVNTNPVQHYS